MHFLCFRECTWESFVLENIRRPFKIHERCHSDSGEALTLKEKPGGTQDEPKRSDGSYVKIKAYCTNRDRQMRFGEQII